MLKGPLDCDTLKGNLGSSMHAGKCSRSCVRSSHTELQSADRALVNPIPVRSTVQEPSDSQRVHIFVGWGNRKRLKVKNLRPP